MTTTDSPPAMPRTTPNVAAPVVDPLLYIHVTTLNDLEQQRVATQNRHSALTRIESGWGLPETHPDVKRMADLADALLVLEHQAELALGRALRRCPLHPWIKQQIGLGDRQVARLLGEIGDPYWNMRDERPRTVSQLWAYCGLHVLPASQLGTDDRLSLAGGDDGGNPGHGGTVAHHGDAGVAARRRRGERANWSSPAKTRAYLIATSCIRHASSPYRDVYDQRRNHTATTHPDWTPGHSHNDALRITSKAILRDLWREARRLHEGTDA